MDMNAKKERQRELSRQTFRCFFATTWLQQEAKVFGDSVASLLTKLGGLECYSITSTLSTYAVAVKPHVGKKTF